MGDNWRVMVTTLGRIKKKILTAASCGLLLLIPAIEGCSDNDSAYGPPCYYDPPDCNSNQYCESTCGSNYYCEFPSPDAGTGTCVQGP